MPQKPPIHTVPKDGGWANLREGSSRSGKTYAQKAEAEQAGRKTAQRDKAEHVIHKRDGTIGERNSYGNDPHPPRG